MITSNQKKELDRLWSKAIRNIYPRCCLCGSEATDAHHVAGRGLSVHWLLVNGAPVCRLCHSMEKSTDTRKRDLFKNGIKSWYVAKFSDEAYNDIQALSKRLANYVDYEAIKNTLLKFKGLE